MFISQLKEGSWDMLYRDDGHTTGILVSLLLTSMYTTELKKKGNVSFIIDWLKSACFCFFDLLIKEWACFPGLSFVAGHNGLRMFLSDIMSFKTNYLGRIDIYHATRSKMLDFDLSRS